MLFLDHLFRTPSLNNDALCTSLINLHHIFFADASLSPPNAVTKPRLFYPVHGRGEDFFVDGGLVANFPLHVYDGWYCKFLFVIRLLSSLPSTHSVHRFGLYVIIIIIIIIIYSFL